MLGRLLGPRTTQQAQALWHAQQKKQRWGCKKGRQMDNEREKVFKFPPH